jgi:hypothetical protein
MTPFYTLVYYLFFGLWAKTGSDYSWRRPPDPGNPGEKWIKGHWHLRLNLWRNQTAPCSLVFILGQASSLSAVLSASQMTTLIWTTAFNLPYLKLEWRQKTRDSKSNGNFEGYSEWPSSFLVFHALFTDLVIVGNEESSSTCVQRGMVWVGIQ